MHAQNVKTCIIYLRTMLSSEITASGEAVSDRGRVKNDQSVLLAVAERIC